MTFTKTSQKFGQWADSRANTVYGLGFATEQQLHQVNEKYFSPEPHWPFPKVILLRVHRVKQAVTHPLLKSFQTSLRRWKTRLVWHGKSRRTKNWPTLRLPSLLLRWAPPCESCCDWIKAGMERGGRKAKEPRAGSLVSEGSESEEN